MQFRRSKAREVALQLLFQRDQAAPPARAVVEQFVADRLGEPNSVAFCLQLYDGACAHLGTLDLRLAAAADNWRVGRMTPFDRNILRLGAYELLYTLETPTAVILNEAIELAHRFGTADSPKFVNGVLDRLSKSRPAAP